MIEDFYQTGRPIAMVCHAPAILRDVKLTNSKYLVEGLNLNGFKDAEDAEIELDRHLFFALEQELKRRGANYKSVTYWAPNVVVDGTSNDRSKSRICGTISRGFKRYFKK